MINVLPYEQKYGLPQGMLNAVMRTESSGNPNAVSPKGAQGLFQFMPETAKELGIDPMNPEQAADGAARYLKQHYDRFGDWNLALAAYNAGPGNVQKYGGIPPFQETQNYVQKVSAHMAQPTQQIPLDATGQAPMVMASGWRSRATPIQPAGNQAPAEGTPPASWRSRATKVDVQAPVATKKQSLFMQGLQPKLDTRDAQIQEAADAQVRGEQGPISTAFQSGLANASKATDFVGELLRADQIGAAIGKLPSYGGGTIGERIPGELKKVLPGDYEQFKQNHPTAARNIRAAGQAVNVGTLIPAAGVASQLARRGGEALEKAATGTKTALKVKAAEPPAPGAAEFKSLANQDYDTSEWLGAKFQPKDVADKVDTELKQVAPKPLANGKFTKEDQVFMDNLDDFQGLRGKELTLADIKRLDEALGQKITQKFVDPRTGMPDANGLRLQKFQQKIRQLVDDVDEAGNDALINARSSWKAHTILRDLDTIAERASMTQNPARSMQTAYKNLYFDKDAIRGWPKEAVELLKKAGTPGLGAEAISTITSRIPAAIGLGTGNIPAAATAQLAGMAARGADEAIVAGRGAKVQQAIVADALKKRRDVNIPEPKPDAPLMLPAPGKASPLPMTDKQVGIAQRLMNRPAERTAQGEGVITPPASQLNKLQETLSKSQRIELNNLAQSFKAGDLSQNKFVEQAVNQFGLTNTQARSLAKEIQNYTGSVGDEIFKAGKKELKKLKEDQSGSIRLFDDGKSRDFIGKFEESLSKKQFQNYGRIVQDFTEDAMSYTDAKAALKAEFKLKDKQIDEILKFYKDDYEENLKSYKE